MNKGIRLQLLGITFILIGICLFELGFRTSIFQYLLIFLL